MEEIRFRKSQFSAFFETETFKTDIESLEIDYQMMLFLIEMVQTPLFRGVK